MRLKTWGISGWATIGLALLAVVVYFWPRGTELLVYDRTALHVGQIWRLWTGHLTHVNLGHLVWNLAVFLPAGVWLERLHPALTRWFYFGAALAISILLYLVESTLLRYSGLSGIATGQLVLLAMLQLKRGSGEPPWFWIAVLLLVATKIAIEAASSTPIFVDLSNGVRNVPLAHIGGVACAFATFFVHRRFSRV